MPGLRSNLTGLRFRDKLIVAAIGPLLPVLASGALGLWVMVGLSRAQHDIVEVNRHLEAEQDLVGLIVDAESSERGFVITGDDRFFQLYESAVAAVPAQVAELRELSRSEPDQAGRAARMGELFDTWRTTVAGPILEARKLIPGALPADGERRQLMAVIARRISLGEGRVLTDEIRLLATQFENQEHAAGTALLDRGRARRAMALTVSAMGLALALGFALWIAWLIARRTSRALSGLAEGAEALADGDLTQRARVRGNDEIAHLARAFNRMSDRMSRRDDERKLRRQVAELLQASASLEEAFEVVSRMGARLLPSGRGGIYRLDASRRDLTLAACFGRSARELAAEFKPDECWAIRRAQVHRTLDGLTPPCVHVADEPPTSLCLPLATQGEIFGVFHFEIPATEWRLPEADDLLASAESFGGDLSLALGNLRLRDSLRDQSIRDPLTGLYNRRYFEETFEREIQRAVRGARPLTLMLLDLDHFKHFNDTFGHEAGDLVLKEVGNLLRQVFRAGDVPCRLGGEEFVVILPDVEPDAIRPRAEELATRLRNRELQLRKQPLGRVTLSAGLAGMPEHGTTQAELLQAADLALYAAKRRGRDRLLVAS
jgi:diguanylate cyclase (GGDEF)-like protein